MGSNRASVAQRLDQLEQRLAFTMETLAVTRQDQIGTRVSQSFETLFQMGVRRDHQPKSVDHRVDVVSADADASTPPGPRSAPGPDGFPGTDRAGADDPGAPASGDLGRAADP